MSEAVRFKSEIEAVSEHLGTLRQALTKSYNSELEESVEELAACLEELRVAEEELYEKDQSLAEASADLRNEHRRYRDLFEFSPDGYLVTDSKGVVREANLIAAKMLQVRRDRLLGKPIVIFLPQGVHDHLLDQFRSVGDLDSSRVHKVQTKVHPRRGVPFYASITSSVIHDAKGKQAGLRLLIRDITESKQREDDLNNSKNELRALAARLQEIREEERNHLARELHDEFGAALTALKLDLAWIKAHIAWAVPEIHQRIDSMSNLIDITTQSVSRTATMLRPRLLDHFGLVAAIEWQAHDFQTRSGIECHLQADEVELLGDPATALFRIFQECLTNVARHAEATKVEITLNRQNGYILLEIHDDGKGVTKEKISSSTSLGLLGMRERAYAFGGDVKIESDDGRGTTVRVQIRIPQEQRAKSRENGAKSKNRRVEVRSELEECE